MPHLPGFNPNMALALLVFAAAYVLIFAEVMHRTYAAVIGAVAMLGVGMAAGFYTQEQALMALDANTLLLLMGMMMLITMLKPTGGFEYLGIRLAKLAHGRSLLLLIYLSLAVSLISMFLDNVTTILIFAPLTVLMTRMLKLNPLPYLMAEAMMSNIGGIATLIGDPPNLIIGSAARIDFSGFLLHMGPVIATTWGIVMILLIFLFRREMRANRRFAKLHLDERKAIKDFPKLMRILLALSLVMILFFIHHRFHLFPAFVTWIGVALALFLMRPEPEQLFGQIEWSVLLFFAALFMLVGGLEASGLLHLAGQSLAGIARNPDKLLITCLSLMWIAALISAFVDNIPFTVTMIPIVQNLETHGINITPLWWALALGAGLGGNGTHIGATANIICIAEAERSEIPEANISPIMWIRKGIPVLLTSLSVSSLFFILFFDFFL